MVESVAVAASASSTTNAAAAANAASSSASSTTNHNNNADNNRNNNNNNNRRSSSSTIMAPMSEASDDVLRGAAKKLASITAYDQRTGASGVGDRKIMLGLFTLLAVVMLIFDALGLTFTVQRMFQGDSRTLLAAFSISMGVNASQIVALLIRVLMLHLGDFNKRELVLRQTILFRISLALGSIVCVCVLLAGLFVVPTEDFASNLNPRLSDCNSVGCATVMAAVALVLNALNVCWLLSTMFTMPTSFWYRWHNGLDVTSDVSSNAC